MDGLSRVQPMQFLPYFLTKGENHLLSFQPHSPFLPVARIELFRFSGSWLHVSTDSTQKNDFIRSLSPGFMRKSRYSDLLLTMFWQLSSIPRQFSKNVAIGDWIWTNGSCELTMSWQKRIMTLSIFSRVKFLTGRSPNFSVLKDAFLSCRSWFQF